MVARERSDEEETEVGAPKDLLARRSSCQFFVLSICLADREGRESTHKEGSKSVKQVFRLAESRPF